MRVDGTPRELSTLSPSGHPPQGGRGAVCPSTRAASHAGCARPWRRLNVQTDSMENAEGRTLLRQLVDDRQLVGRVAFCLFVFAVWSVLQSRRSLRLLRQQWKG